MDVLVGLLVVLVILFLVGCREQQRVSTRDVRFAPVARQRPPARFRETPDDAFITGLVVGPHLAEHGASDAGQGIAATSAPSCIGDDDDYVDASDFYDGQCGNADAASDFDDDTDW